MKKDKFRDPLKKAVFSSIFVALTGVTVIYSTSLLLKIPIYFRSLLIIFLVAFAVYNANKKTDKKEDNINYPERTIFIHNNERLFIYLSIISYVIALIVAFYFNFWAGLFTLLPFISVILYSSNPIRLKRFFLIKNALVSFTWALFVTCLPMIFFGNFLFLPALSVFFFIFLKGLGNTIAFDMRDILGDKTYGIKTVPLRYGIKKSKHILLIINSSSFFLIVVSVYFGVLPNIGYLISLVTFYTYFYIYLISKIDLKFLTDILVDGEFIIMGILALIGILIF